MARELILMADVVGLGLEGEVVRVSNGYARNYLEPNKLAIPVSEAARRQLEKNRQAREERLQRNLEAAQTLAKTLEQLSCTIVVKVGDNEQMYGSVGVNEIVNHLKQQGIELDKRQILLPEPIRETGVYSVNIKLHPAVEAAVKVWVVGE